MKTCPLCLSRYDFFDTKLVYKYRTYKILESSFEELMNSSNPFELVVLAAKNAINAKNTEGLYQDKIISIFRKVYDKEC